MKARAPSPCGSRSRRQRDRNLPVPGTAEFAEAAHRESLAVAAGPHEKEDQAFIDAISVWNEEEP